MNTLPHELIALIGITGGPLNALIMMHTCKYVSKILNDFNVTIAGKNAPKIAAEINSLNIIKYLSAAEYEINEAQVVIFVSCNNILALEYLRNYTDMGASIWTAAICESNIDALDFAYDRKIPFGTRIKLDNMVIRGDFAPVVAWFNNHADIDFDFDILSTYAARTGNVELFKIVCPTFNSGPYYYTMAIRYGHFEMVKYLYSAGCVSSEVLTLGDNYNASGVKESIKFVLDNYSNNIEFYMDEMGPAIIALGDMEFLKECIRRYGCSPTVIDDKISIRMRNYLIARGADMYTGAMLAAIEARDEEMIRFYVAGGYTIDEEILCDACSLDYDLMKLIHDAAPIGTYFDGMYVVMIRKDSNTRDSSDTIIRKLEYFHAKGPICNIMTIACCSVYVELVEWAISRGYKFESKEYLYALEAGSYRNIYYLYGIMADSLDHISIFEWAIKYGRTEVLEFIKLKVNVTADMFVLAAKCSRPECVRWLHAAKYDWDCRLIFVAIEVNSFEIVKFLLDNEYPIPGAKLLIDATQNRHAIKSLLIGRNLI